MEKFAFILSNGSRTMLPLTKTITHTAYLPSGASGSPVTHG